MLTRLLVILLSALLSMQSFTVLAEELPGEQCERIEARQELVASFSAKKVVTQSRQVKFCSYPKDVYKPSYTSPDQLLEPIRRHLRFRALLI